MPAIAMKRLSWIYTGSIKRFQAGKKVIYNIIEKISIELMFQINAVSSDMSSNFQEALPADENFFLKQFEDSKQRQRFWKMVD